MYWTCAYSCFLCKITTTMETIKRKSLHSKMFITSIFAHLTFLFMKFFLSPINVNIQIIVYVYTLLFQCLGPITLYTENGNTFKRLTKARNYIKYVVPIIVILLWFHFNCKQFLRRSFQLATVNNCTLFHDNTLITTSCISDTFTQLKHNT